MQFHTIITSGLFCVKYIKLSLRDIVQNRMFNLHGICCFLQFNKLHLYLIPLSNKLRNLSLWVFHIICSFVFLLIRLFLNCNHMTQQSIHPKLKPVRLPGDFHIHCLIQFKFIFSETTGGSTNPVHTKPLEGGQL